MASTARRSLISLFFFLLIKFQFNNQTAGIKPNTEEPICICIASQPCNENDHLLAKIHSVPPPYQDHGIQPSGDGDELSVTIGLKSSEDDMDEVNAKDIVTAGITMHVI